MLSHSVSVHRPSQNALKVKIIQKENSNLRNYFRCLFITLYLTLRKSSLLSSVEKQKTCPRSDRIRLHYIHELIIDLLFIINTSTFNLSLGIYIFHLLKLSISNAFFFFCSQHEDSSYTVVDRRFVAYCSRPGHLLYTLVD